MLPKVAKKVYIHLESKDPALPISTFIVNLDDETTLSQVQQKVSKHLESLTGANYDESSVFLVTASGKPLSRSLSAKVTDIIEYHEGLSDFHVFESPKVATKKPSATVAAATKSAAPTEIVKKPAVVNKTSSVAKEETPSKATSELRAGPSEALKAEVLEAHRKLEELMRKKQYKQCKALADVLIQNNCDRSFAHNCLGLIAIETRDLDESIRQCKNAVQADRTNPNSYFIMGKAYIQKGQFEDAVDILDKGAKVWKARSVVTPIKDRDEHLYLDMVALQAEAMFADGDHNDAANLLNSLMGNPNCDRNMNVLVTYSSFALQYRKLEEAVVAFLKSIALKQPDPRITRLAVDILTNREGFQEFIRQFPPAMPESAEVYAFLGTLVKEMSAMDTSVSLYQIATRLQPENPSYMLNLVHVLEIKQSFDEGLDLLRTFYTKNNTMGFRQQQSSHAIAINTTCARMADAMQPPSSSSGRHCQITWVVESPSNHNRGFAQVEHVALDAPPEGLSSPSSSSSSSCAAPTSSTTTTTTTSTSSSSLSTNDEDDAPSNDAVDVSLSRRSSSGGSSSGSSASSSASPYDDPDHTMYTFVTRELDLIALYATTVKVYYLKGLLSHLPMMITLIERIRAMSQVPLHETLVRNELAYYQDIVQILSVRTHAALYGLPDVSFALNDPLKSNKPEWVAARKRPLYLCGDSHCLSGGWSIVQVHSLPRLIIPKLVTGIKHWHLRPESKFYPKENFLQTIGTIPIGSEVIFVLGEIDCREGLLTAVERGIYASLEEGMRKTIAIFVKLLKDLKRSRKFRVWWYNI